MNPLIILGAIVALVMMFGAVLALFVGRGEASVDARLDTFVGRMPEAAQSAAEAEPQRKRKGMADQMDRALSGRGFFDSIKRQIVRADVRLRVSEYIVIVIVVALGVGFTTYRYFDNSLIFGLAGGFVGSRIPRTYLRFAANRRLRTFDGQLGDTLNLWVNSLRSGYAVLQGMEAIATELPPPVSKEFERVVQEVRLGLSMQEALDNMLRRVPSEDLDLVVTAVNIQREVGGNLAEILDIVSHTIRERVRIKGEIRTLTAQGRISGWTITFLPMGLGFVLYGLNRSYIMELFVKERPFALPGILPCGWLIVAISVAMTITGGLLIRKIVDIEV